MKIKTRLTLYILVILLIPLAVWPYVFFNDVSEIMAEKILEDENHGFNVLSVTMTDYLKGFNSDVLFLSRLPSLEKLVRSEDEEVRSLAMADLEKEFLAFSEEREIYYQVRYINEAGQEVVRVDSDGKTSKLIPEDKLQNKKGRYYFDDAAKVDKGIVFISPLDLNIEQGEIENRGTENDPEYVPVLRYATPVLSANNVFRGIIITNVYASQFLNILDSAESSNRVFLLNKDGYYLYHSDKDKEWGFMFDNDETLQKESPELFNRLLSQEAGQFFDKKSGRYIIFKKIYPSSEEAVSSSSSSQAHTPSTGTVQEKDYFWILAEFTPENILIVATKEITNKILTLVLLFIVFSIIVIYLIGRSISRPIKVLQQGAEIIKQGNLNYRVGTKSKDEIGQLSRAFDEMTESIKQSRSKVDEKVEEQTKEIKEKAERLSGQREAMLNIAEDAKQEKKRTDEEKEKVESILESIGDGVFVVNEGLEITMFNGVAEKISGFKAEEAIGKNYKEILKFVFEDSEETNDEFIKRAIETKEVQEMSNHTILIDKNSNRIPVADSASPLMSKDGEVKGCVVVFRDVTKEREVDKAKTEFVSLASHQLRTPLSSINWYAEMLLNEDVGGINEEQRDFLKEIYIGNQKMIDIVNSFLNVSRLELGTFGIEVAPTNLKEIAEDAFEEIKKDIKEKKIDVKKDYDEKLEEIELDPRLVRIIIQNLLSNAVKYTKEGGKVKIKIEKRENEEDIIIEVSDNGIGIPQRQQKNIFTKLFRADNAKENDTKGTGLGLYIVKSILDSAGGDVWFESEEEKGTTFSVSLPLSGWSNKKGAKTLD